MGPNEKNGPRLSSRRAPTCTARIATPVPNTPRAPRNRRDRQNRRAIPKEIATNWAPIPRRRRQPGINRPTGGGQELRRLLLSAPRHIPQALTSHPTMTWVMSLRFTKNHIPKMLKAFYRKHIRKHHAFILCKHEKRTAIRLDLMLKNNATTYFCKPFGVSSQCAFSGFYRPTEIVVEVVRALILFHDLAHEAGYSFDGRLLVTNLYWVPETKSIKVAGLVIGEMVKKTDESIRSDYTAQHDMIRDEVFAGSKVPRELRHLMRFMISNPILYRNLITHNVCLLDDEAKVGRFIVLYQKLAIIKKLDKNIFWSAMSYVTCGRCDQWHDWRGDVKLNDALKEVYDYKKVRGYYTPDEDGVTWFGRNCCGHVTDYSVDSENGQLVIKYTNADTFPMLECHVPGLFAQVEEAVFSVVEIDYPQELQCLRNSSTGGV